MHSGATIMSVRRERRRGEGAFFSTGTPSLYALQWNLCARLRTCSTWERWREPRTDLQDNKRDTNKLWQSKRRCNKTYPVPSLMNHRPQTGMDFQRRKIFLSAVLLKVMRHLWTGSDHAWAQLSCTDTKLKYHGGESCVGAFHHTATLERCVW